MSKELQTRLRELRATNKNIKPDEAWVKATRETLMMQVRNTLPTSGKVTFSERLKLSINYLVPKGAVRWVSRPVMAILSIIIVLTGGSIMSVSAAEQSLPGDLLYGLKLATEQARLAMTSEKGDKLKLKTEFTGRRVDELRKVASTDQKTEKVAQVAEILKRDLNTLKEQLNDVAKDSSSDKVVEAAKMVDQKSNEVINALQETKEQLSPETIEKVTEAQSVAADTGVKALEVLVEQHQVDSGSVPVSDVAQALQDHAKAVSDATMTDASSTLPAVTSTLPVTTSTVVLTDLASTTTASTTSESLSSLVSQVKDATTQAFALQKVKDQLEVTASAAENGSVDASSTDQGVAASGTPVAKPDDKPVSSTTAEDKKKE